MMDKKSNGEYDHRPILTKHGNNIMSAFNTISKKFRRLKNDYFKVDVTNAELPCENLPNDNKRRNVVKRWSSLSRIKERSDKKSNSKSQINIVQWSSNESVAEPKSKKFNSLKLSRGLSLIPQNCENDSSPEKSFHANDRSNAVKNTDKDIENNVCCLDCNETYIVPYEDKLCNEKLSDTNNKYCSVLSLHGLSENDGYNEITIEKCTCFTTDNNENIINQSHNDFIDFSMIEIPKTSRTNSFQNIKFQPFEHSKDRYLSTPVLINRPPLPLVPKPINRRNKALNYESKENLMSDVSQDLCNLRPNDSNLKRTFSDCVHNKFISDEYINNAEENAISAVIEKEKPKPLLQKKDDKVWRNVSSAMIIAEAVWDHGSMKSDELSFSSGAVIYVLFTDDENWWWGIHNGVTGWFPVSYVRLRVDQEIDGDSEHFRGLHSLKEESLFPSQLCTSNKTVEHMTKVRAKCVEELLNTEKVYVKLLKDIIQGYVMEVDAETRLFTPEDKLILFSNIEELYFFHQVFLADLQKAVYMECMEKSIVGHVFLKHQSNFEIYSNYCNNQPRSSARLSVLSKDKKINVFFESCRLRQNMIRLSLDGFLLSPVQRICKYPLQIKELIKHTMVDHPDFPQLLEAQACMQNVASLINERKRRLENINKLAMWQLSISNWKDEDLVTRSSMLLQKGTLNKISNNKYIKCNLFLFDHQLIVMRQESQKKTSLLYLHRIDLDQAKVEDLSDGSIIINSEIVNNAFKIWCEKRQKWYIFSVPNTDLKLLWKSAFVEERRLVNEEIQKGFVVSTEVRAAAMENAYNQYIAERKRIRLKSVSTTYPAELETFKTFSYATMVEPFIHVGTDQVVRRTNRKERSKSFRHSLHGFIFEKTT